MNANLMLGRLFDAIEFLRWQSRIGAIPGWLDDAEGYLLHLLAAEGPASGAVVEVGSYIGRSTAWLASGSARAGRGPVVAVDHFRGSPEHQPGGRNESPQVVSEGTTFPQFRHHLTQLGLWEHVEPRVGSSEEAARNWAGPVRLVFIDADHSYEESRKDFLLWSPFVSPAGLVCFHDIGVWPGVTAFYRELLVGGAGFSEIAAVRSLRVVQRQAAPRGTAPPAPTSG